MLGISFTLSAVAAGRGRRCLALGLSLPWLLSAGLTGCFAPPPELSQPEQTSPFIITAQATPPLAMVHKLPADGVFQFSVPFISEDVGEELRAVLYQDLSPGDSDPVVVYRASIAAGTSMDEREVGSGVPLAPIPLGCHSLTLMITHESNLDFFDSPLPIAPALAASVIWWLDVADAENPTLIDSCPPRGEVPP